MMLNLLSTITAGASGLIANSYTKKGSEHFMDSDTSTAMIVILVLVLVTLFVAGIIAVYRVTSGSILQVILFVLFGSLYLWLAIIVYGFSNYKFMKITKV